MSRKCKTDSQTVIKAAGDPGKKRSTESSARECEGGLFLFLLLMEKYTLLYLTLFTSASTSTLTSTPHSVYTMRQNSQSSFMGTKGKGERGKGKGERSSSVWEREGEREKVTCSCYVSRKTAESETPISPCLRARSLVAL